MKKTNQANHETEKELNEPQNAGDVSQLDQGTKKKVKKRWTTKRIINFVLDVVLFSILIFSSFFSVSLIITKKKTGVPMVFGYAMITVVSGSMRDAGFEVGESAFIKQIDAHDVAVGDYVAFFDYVDPTHPRPATIANGERPKSTPNKNRIVFHEIIEIITDANGDLWFRTKGTNNATADYNLVYQDYIIGKHIKEGNGFAKFMQFVHSTLGIICLVVVPCVIILFRDCYELLTIIFEYNDEKKKQKKAQTLADDKEDKPDKEKSDENKTDNLEQQSTQEENKTEKAVNKTEKATKKAATKNETEKRQKKDNTKKETEKKDKSTKPKQDKKE